MQETKGTCKHGEFILREGCPQCIKAFNGAISELETGQPALVAETSLALRPGEDLEVHGYYEEASRLLEYAEARVIATVEDLKPVTDDLSLIAKLKKAMEAKKKEYLDPPRAQIEAIRATYDYLMLPVLTAGKITGDKMLAFNKEQERIRLEQVEINQLRFGAAQKEMELTGELSESVGLVEVIPEVKRVSTDMGTAGMTDHWKYEVVDFALLPDEFKVVDSAMLNTIAKKHHDTKQIAGVRFYNEPIIAVRAR